MVGCVLTRDGEPVGEGWHEEFGGPHAEVNAIYAAGESTRGATAYVSLEPCSHYGQTRPCSEALLEAGVTRVVFGAADPGAATGGGAKLLEQAGVEVVGPASDVGTFHDVDPVFFHTSKYRRPYVALKLAVSLDGRIAAREGERTLLTGDEANREVHRLRSGFDAVLVGGETARIDDPLLTVRFGFDPRIQPTRVVVDPRAMLSPDAAMLGAGSEAPVVVFATEAAPPERVEALVDVGARVEIVPQGGGGADLEKMLERCWHLGLRSVFCEGGARLARVLAREGLAQRFYVFQGPVTLGSKGVLAFDDESSTPEGLGWSLRGEPIQFGPDVLITYDNEGG